MLITIGEIKITAEKLQDALDKVVPKKRKNSKKKIFYPLTISYDEIAECLILSESAHHLKSFQIPGKWFWPEPVQIDGHVISKIINNYLPNEVLEIKFSPETIKISNGRSSLNISRLDAVGKSKIIETPIPKNKRHLGKVNIEPDHHIGRVELNHTFYDSLKMVFLVIPVLFHK